MNALIVLDVEVIVNIPRILQSIILCHSIHCEIIDLFLHS
uniref:Uncharacterized protein n=1 Tax=viral metagenome TaxID=1070528 RepID=A0A6C0BNN6_9ZZZZ